VSKFVSVATSKRTGPGRYSVGGNLYLDVAKGGTASWMFMYRFGGKQREMSLGSADLLKRDDAKLAADEQRIILKVQKLDPLAVRRQKPVTAQTVEALIEEVIEARKGGWKDGEEGAQRWRTIVKTHIPALLPMLVTEVTFELLLKTFLPQWDKQRAFLAQDILETALDLAFNKGQVARNVATWKGGLDCIMPKKIAVSKKRDALDAAEVPALVARLVPDTDVAAKPLLAIILSGMRDEAVREMKWTDLDVDAKVWTVPAKFMKRKKGQEQRDFDVPLSDQLLALITSMPQTHEQVFPSATGKVISNTVMNKKMAALGLKGGDDNVDIHGFRSTFSTWGNNHTKHEGRAIDAAIGHITKATSANSQAEGVYNRADYFDKRVPLMQDWADFCFGVSKVAVLPTRKKAA
jgi:integrase